MRNITIFVTLCACALLCCAQEDGEGECFIDCGSELGCVDSMAELHQLAVSNTAYKLCADRVQRRSRGSEANRNGRRNHPTEGEIEWQQDLDCQFGNEAACNENGRSEAAEAREAMLATMYTDCLCLEKLTCKSWADQTPQFKAMFERSYDSSECTNADQSCDDVDKNECACDPHPCTDSEEGHICVNLDEADVDAQGKSYVCVNSVEDIANYANARGTSESRVFQCLNKDKMSAHITGDTILEECLRGEGSADKPAQKRRFIKGRK